jgi:hypothetical protein
VLERCRRQELKERFETVIGVGFCVVSEEVAGQGEPTKVDVRRRVL